MFGITRLCRCRRRSGLRTLGRFTPALLGALLGVFSAGSARAWSPKTHLYTANQAIQRILSGYNEVVVDGRTYPVDNRVAQAIRNYPTYYRGGVVGPDAFPDIYVGQTVIHPDTRLQNGRTPDGQQAGHGHSFSHEWLRHVYEAGWATYNSNRGNARGQQALAFAYGFLTHAGGDMWGHTLVNEFARGVFEIKDLDIAARHIIVESYVGRHTPDTDLSIAAPHDFVFETMINNDGFVDSQGQTARSLGRGEIFDYFYALRDRVVKKKEHYKKKSDCKWYDAPCHADRPYHLALKEYMEAWIDDIDRGLRAWPAMSEQVARKLFSSPSADWNGAKQVVRNFAYDPVLSMLGAPDFVGVSLRLIRNVIGSIVDDVLGPVIEPLRDVVHNLEVNLIEKATGINIDTLREYAQQPESYINVSLPPISLPPTTSQQLDRLMGIANGVDYPNAKFDPMRFAAVKNTVVTSSLALLSPKALNLVLADHGVSPIYREEPPYTDRDNFLLGYIRSLDGNHQWRQRSTRAGDGRRFGEGAPLWMDGPARERVFRVLFQDWEHGEPFPDLGEYGDSKKRIPTPPNRNGSQ